MLSYATKASSGGLIYEQKQNCFEVSLWAAVIFATYTVVTKNCKYDTVKCDVHVHMQKHQIIESAHDNHMNYMCIMEE